MKSRVPRTEAEWHAIIEERIKQLPKSAPECQKRQHDDNRKDTKRRMTGFIVNGKETHVIVVQEISGKYNLPGGRRKRGEQPVDGVFREICEEVGLEFNNEDISDMKEYHDYIFYIRLTEPDINEIFVSPGPEINEVFWYPLEHFIPDLEKSSSPFSLTTINLLPIIRDILGVKSMPRLTYEQLKQAVMNNDTDFLDRNLDQYTEGQINSVTSIAAQVSIIPVLDRLLDYSTVYVNKLLNLAIGKRRNDTAKYLIDNFRSEQLLEEALKTASEYNNKEIISYIRKLQD